MDGVDEIDDHAKLSNALLRLELEDVDGGDSDEDVEEFETHDEAITRAILDRSQAGEGGIDVEERSSGDIAFVIGKSMALNSLPEDILTTIPSVPLDWKTPVMRNGDDPSFDDVDNPGAWNDFIFRPVYNNKGVGANASYKYTWYELPTGAVPVKPDDDGKQIENF